MSELSKIKALNCHFELSLESEKSIRILKYALNLWILHFATQSSVWQNLELCVKFTWIFSSKMLFFRGLPRKFLQNLLAMTANFVILSVSEKSIRILKYALNLWILHFATQSSVWQILELCVKFTWIFSSKMLFFRGLPRFAFAKLAMTANFCHFERVKWAKNP